VGELTLEKRPLKHLFLDQAGLKHLFLDRAGLSKKSVLKVVSLKAIHPQTRQLNFVTRNSCFGNHTVEYDPFIKSQLKQLTLGPCVLQIW